MKNKVLNYYIHNNSLKIMERIKKIIEREKFLEENTRTVLIEKIEKSKISK